MFQKKNETLHRLEAIYRGASFNDVYKDIDTSIKVEHARPVYFWK